MKRKLIRQMLNEWKTNVWLVVELVIVVLVLQFIFALFYHTYQQHEYVTGQKLENIYCARVHLLAPDSEDYTPYDSVHTAVNDMDMLLVKLRANPYVEIAAVGGYNALPYNYNFQGASFYYKTAKGKSNGLMSNRRQMSPEMLELFGIRGINGETPKQLADMLRKGQIILSPLDRNFNPDAPDASEFIGKDVYAGEDSLTTYRVGAVAYSMNRTDYEPAFAATAYMSDRYDLSSVAVRVKPGMGNKFVESLTDKDMQGGNLYLTRFKSIENMRDNAHLDINLQIRNFMICGMFIMLVIFLGFLGTFWFRTQQRVSEIAIRKVNGATNGNIYSRFFAEGLLLLLLGVLFSLPVSLWFYLTDKLVEAEIMPSVGVDVFLVATALTVLSLTLLIVAGIYAPARRATRIDPAAALKDM
ncbi:MAG: ABC transporter permease [Muribaculaceae bacterium]